MSQSLRLLFGVVGRELQDGLSVALPLLARSSKDRRWTTHREVGSGLSAAFNVAL